MPELIATPGTPGFLGGSSSGRALPGRLSSLMGYQNPIAAMRSLAPLPFYAQQLIDKAVIQVGLQRLVITADLLAEGLTFPLPNWLSVTQLYWEKESKVGNPRRVMNPGARGERAITDRLGVRIPIYCTIDDFQLSIRLLMESERANQPLDVSLVEQTIRRCNESIEDATINGSGVTAAGLSAPGLINAPGVNTYHYTGALAWDNATNTGTQILQDVLNMITTLQGVQKYGPYNLYIPTSYGIALTQDFKTYGTISIMERLQQINSGGRNLQIRVADLLPANTTILMQMTSDVCDVVMGQQPTMVSWEEPNGWERTFVALACVIARPKSDYNNHSGIIIGTPS